MSFTTIPYETSTVDEATKDLEEKNGLFIVYEAGPIKAVITAADCFGVKHLQFRAMTDGWESFTETGYKSHFTNGSVELDTPSQVKEFFELILSSVGFVAPTAVQTGLF